MQKGTSNPSLKSAGKKRALPDDGPVAGPSGTHANNFFPLFARPAKQAKSEHDTASAQAFRWIQPTPFLPGVRTTSCLYGVNKEPDLHPKIAIFDLDGTVIKSTFAKAKSKVLFEWWNKTVPVKLKELHEDGYAIVFISNQNLGDTRVKSWKTKFNAIAESLPDLPFRIFAATDKDIFRKPLPGMWYALESIYKSGDVSIDIDASFYVGDAAGRSGDFAGTDRKFASNAGLKFFTPEEYFLDLKSTPHSLKGFNASVLAMDGPTVLPSSTPIVPPKLQPCVPEIVLFVGYPSSGKTAFFKRHFEASAYEHIDESVLKTRSKYLPAIESSIKNGVSCVVETVDSSRGHRKLFLDLAQRLSCSIRCFAFQASFDLAWHNNIYRALGKPVLAAHRSRVYEPWEMRSLTPKSNFETYKATHEEPTLAEGFGEIKKVHWKFEGEEEERRLWNMWLQIDGK
ncbi:PNK3P-domain-containing protein [Schizopora paradoxa]|uniref:PNK3P-domain-containing protein n=1 Tax=Schizopora paradoxa TaxID=27342 RepID=A0A0H2SPX5_9AGAM|nr:PNK3P-domain-containing protein [Schizopora paradoxa]